MITVIYVESEVVTGISIGARHCYAASDHDYSQWPSIVVLFESGGGL